MKDKEKEMKSKKKKAEEAEKARKYKRKDEAEELAWYIRYEARQLLFQLIERKDWEDVILIADAIDKMSWVSCNLGDYESTWTGNNLKKETLELLEDIRKTTDEVIENVKALDK